MWGSHQIGPTGCEGNEKDRPCLQPESTVPSEERWTVPVLQRFKSEKCERNPRPHEPKVAACRTRVSRSLVRQVLAMSYRRFAEKEAKAKTVESFGMSADHSLRDAMERCSVCLEHRSCFRATGDCEDRACPGWFCQAGWCRFQSRLHWTRNRLFDPFWQGSLKDTFSPFETWFVSPK